MKCYNGTRISESNKKMGEVGSFSTLPVITCNKNAPCFKECYAKRMCTFRKSVYESWLANTEMVQNGDWGKIYQDVVDYVRFRHATMFRWFVGGDIYNTGMLETMITVAEDCPETQFLAFTKQYDVLEGYDVPENLHIVLSAWNGFQPSEDLKKRFPVCYYDDGSMTDSIPKDAKTCLGGCESCQECWKMTAGQSVRIYKH